MSIFDVLTSLSFLYVVYRGALYLQYRHELEQKEKRERAYDIDGPCGPMPGADQRLRNVEVLDTKQILNQLSELTRRVIAFSEDQHKQPDIVFPENMTYEQAHEYLDVNEDLRRQLAAKEAYVKELQERHKGAESEKSRLDGLVQSQARTIANLTKQLEQAANIERQQEDLLVLYRKREKQLKDKVEELEVKDNAMKAHKDWVKAFLNEQNGNKY